MSVQIRQPQHTEASVIRGYLRKAIVPYYYNRATQISHFRCYKLCNFTRTDFKISFPFVLFCSFHFEINIYSSRNISILFILSTTILYKKLIQIDKTIKTYVILAILAICDFIAPRVRDMFAIK